LVKNARAQLKELMQGSGLIKCPRNVKKVSAFIGTAGSWMCARKGRTGCFCHI